MSDSAVYVEGHEGDRGPLPPPLLHSFFIAPAPLLPCSLLCCSVFSLSCFALLLVPARAPLFRSHARSPLPRCSDSPVHWSRVHGSPRTLVTVAGIVLGVHHVGRSDDDSLMMVSSTLSMHLCRLSCLILGYSLVT